MVNLCTLSKDELFTVNPNIDNTTLVGLSATIWKPCAMQKRRWNSPRCTLSSYSSHSLPSFLCLVLSCLKLCQWPCLSLCGQLCHRWSITTGGGLLLAEPRGPADPDKSAVNASPQPNALIGSDRHSGPYASFMPLDPRCRQVCVCVPFSTTLFSTCCWGFMSVVSFPLSPWLNSTQCSGQLSVCVCGMHACVYSCGHVYSSVT